MRKRAEKPIKLGVATIEKMTHEGRGIGHSEGKAVFIANALPGEKVAFRYTKEHPRYAQGEATEILEASSDRVTPPCEHFTLCGGCSLQHMHPDLQVSLKQDTLLEQLSHFGKVIPEEILPPMRAPTEGYRRKARLGVRFVEKKQRLLIGFREKAGRYLAELSSCKVLDVRIGELLPALCHLITDLSVIRDIAQIEVAIGDTQVALVFRNLKALTLEDEQKMIAFGQAHAIQIYLQPGGLETVHLLSPQTLQELWYALPPGNLKIYFDPLDFTQVNAAINQQMVPLACELLAVNAQDNVLDLFCGLGNFSLALAQKAKQVVGVECDEAMIRKAYDNAQRNNIGNVSFYAANLFESLESKPWFSQEFSKILIDPPRLGALEVVSQIEKWQPERIVYVSCNPATFARDAGILVNEKKYRLVKAGVMDMFAHTAHVESIGLFIRK